jgi:hypothetical protein
VDAELARFVRGSRHDSALIGRRPHDHRLPAQLGMVVLLDGRKERVHVNVEYGPVHGRDAAAEAW